VPLKKGSAPVPADLPERGKSENGDARDHAAKAVGVCGNMLIRAKKFAGHGNWGGFLRGQIQRLKAFKTLDLLLEKIRQGGI